MPVTTDGGWDISPIVRELQQVDAKMEAVQRQARVAVTGLYRQAAPGRRLPRKIAGRSTARGRTRRVRVFVRDEPLGAPVNGRDPGSVAVAYWTEHGTAARIYRTTTGPDGRPAPFFFGGRPVASVKGQRGQGWVERARSAGDQISEAMFAELARDVQVSLQRGGAR